MVVSLILKRSYLVSENLPEENELRSSGHAHDERHNKYDEKDKEQELCDAGRCRRNARKPKNGRQKRDEQE
jgi:hypothetical protein